MANHVTELSIHPEKCIDKLDKVKSCDFVLAKGAGPGRWNRWVTVTQGHRIFWTYVRRDYLAEPHHLGRAAA